MGKWLIFLLLAVCLPAGSAGSPFQRPLESQLGAVRELTAESGTCEDDWEGLIELTSQFMPGYETILLQFTCSQVILTDPEVIAGTLAAVGLAPIMAQALSCDADAPDYKASCLAMGGSDELCSTFVGVTAASYCCSTCAVTTVEATYSFGSSTYDDEAEVLVDFLVKSGFTVNGTLPTHTNICSWQGVICWPTFYTLQIRPDFGNITSLAPEVGQLQHLKELHIEQPHLTSPLQLPTEIANCSSLISLIVFDTPGFTGTITALNGATRNFKVSGTNLLSLSNDIFLNLSKLENVDVSNNSITGTFPELDLGMSPLLVSVNGANNQFTGLGEIYNPSVWSGSDALALDLSGNLLTEFPDSIRLVRRLMTLDLSNNSMTSLPDWGYWPEYFWDPMVGNSDYTFYKASYPCPWLYLTTATANASSTVPTWPVLTKVSMDGNNFGSEDWANTDGKHSRIRRFLSFFAQALGLSSLSCNDCGLSGSMTEEYLLSVLHYFQPTEEVSSSGSTETVCIHQAAYENLQSISLLNNPGIVFEEVQCEIMDAESLLSSEFCYTCATGSLVPVDQLPLLSEQADCTCADTLITGYANSGPYCGCSSGSYYDPTSNTCVECPEAYDCDWDDDIVKSRTLPKLRAGYWAECISNRANFDPIASRECLNTDVCIGGSVHIDEGCGESSLCDSSRFGPACGRCLPGQTGSPGDPCEVCESSPAQVRTMMFLVSLLIIPGFLPFIHMVVDSRMKHRTKRSLVQIKSLKSAVRGLLRHMQVIGIFGKIKVEWPSTIEEALNFCQIWSPQFEGLFQSGCIVGEQTGVGSLLIAWITPLYVVLLVMLSVASYSGVNYLLRHFTRCPSSKRITIESGLVFIHFLWVVYFASLTSNILYVFTCKKHSDGRLTVVQFPDITCDTAEYWRVAAGGLLAFFIYVVLFFIVSYLAMKRVVGSLIDTAFQDRGSSEFATDGLRVPCLNFNLVSAAKDVLLNIILVVFINDGVGQLLLSAGVLLAWTAIVARLKPYDTFTANWIDIWASGGLGALLLTTAGFGFAVPGVSDISSVVEMQQTGELWLLFLVFATVGIPNMLVVLEILKLVPCFERNLPRFLQSRSPEAVLEEISEFQGAIPAEQFYKTMSVLDFQEWTLFQQLFGSARAQMRFHKQTCSGRRLSNWPSHTNSTTISNSNSSSRLGKAFSHISTSAAAPNSSCTSPFRRLAVLDEARFSQAEESLGPLEAPQQEEKLAGPTGRSVLSEEDTDEANSPSKSNSGEESAQLTPRSQLEAEQEDSIHV